MKTIKVSLTTESLLDAAKQIDRYCIRLDEKNKEFVKRLGEIGLNVVNTTMQSVPPVDRGEYTAEVVEPVIDGDHMSGIALNLYGDQIMFIEFSSGVTFGQTSFPNLPDGNSYGDGMGTGTFPGQKYAYSPIGWWYKDRWGQRQHTYGLRASMPMYKADVEIVQSIRRIAKEVFG